MLIIGAIICMATAVIGMYIKRIYKLRMVFCNDLLAYIDYAISEIESVRTPFVKITEEYVLTHSGDLKATLEEYISLIISNTLSADKVAKIEIKSANESEKKLLRELLNSVGKYDSKTELANLRKIQKRVQEANNIATAKYKKEGVMAFNLSVLLGVVLMIILA